MYQLIQFRTPNILLGWIPQPDRPGGEKLGAEGSFWSRAPG